MGFFLEFDEANNTVRLTFEGTITQADMGGAAYAALLSFIESRPACKGIVDFTHVTEVEIPSVAIRQHAKRDPGKPSELMFVLVAPQDHIYGLTRMFSTSAEHTLPHLKVARTMEEAYALLGISFPQFVRVSD